MYITEIIKQENLQNNGVKMLYLSSKSKNKNDILEK